jgi:hypothetical protein
MASRWEKIEAKRSAGLCVTLSPDCGSKAFWPWQHCKKHLPPSHSTARWKVQQERASGDRQSLAQPSTE